MPDSVSRVLINAEALEFIAETLPEEEAGMAHLIGLVAKDLKECGKELNDMEDL